MPAGHRAALAAPGEHREREAALGGLEDEYRLVDVQAGAISGVLYVLSWLV